MAFADFTRTASLAPSLGLQSRFDALRARYAQWRVYRTTLAELNGLGARELSDLGLNQSLIKRAAYEAAYGPRA